MANPNMQMPAPGAAMSAPPPSTAGSAEMPGAAGEAAAKGQGGDTIIAHLTPGEIIIPLNVITEELAAQIEAAFKAAGVDPYMYVAGSDKQQINPETGLPMFGFFSSLFGFIRRIAPIAIGFATGNPFLGALAGGVSGALGGGGLRGGLMGALSGYGGASLGGGLASALSGSGGLSGLFSNAVSGVKGFFSNPIGSLTSGISNVGTRLSSLLSGGGSVAPGAAASGAGALAKAGTLSAAGGGASSLAGAGAGLASGGSSGLSLSNLLSGVGGLVANQDAEDQLMSSQRKALGAMSPYMATGKGANAELARLLGVSGDQNSPGFGSLTRPFSPSDLQNDPGYQFNLAQGNRAMDNRLAASGNLDSGGAIKAGQEFGQGLADTTYNNAFNRNLQQNQQIYNNLSGTSNSGQLAAGSAGDIYTNMGEVGAAGTRNQYNLINQSLSGLLSGNGARRIIGYRPDGQPIYA